MKGMHSRYFLEEILSHLKPQQGLSERYQRRAIDVTLAAKLTLTYGKYHLGITESRNHGDGSPDPFS